VHGCNRVVKAGKQANGKVSIHVGFQKRYSEAYRAMMEKIHGGELGDLVLGQSFYYTNDLDRKAKPGMSEMEARIRNWVFDKVLSGDILVEQNIHIIDAVNWAFKSHPIRAMGAGGRIVRKDVGDVWDHFIMTFVYPGEVKVSFNSNQFKNKGYRDQGERFFGTKGVAESHQGGQVFINFNDGTKWDSGTTSALATSVGNKVKAFIEGIKSGKFHAQRDPRSHGGLQRQGNDLGEARQVGREVGCEAQWRPRLKHCDRVARGSCRRQFNQHELRITPDDSGPFGQKRLQQLEFLTVLSLGLFLIHYGRARIIEEQCVTDQQVRDPRGARARA